MENFYYWYQYGQIELLKLQKILFYKVPIKVTESLVIFKKIINYFTKQKYNIRVRYFLSKIRVNNIEDVIKFYKSTTFFKKKYEKTVSDFIRKKYKKKNFVFKKDSCF